MTKFLHRDQLPAGIVKKYYQSYYYCTFLAVVNNKEYFVYNGTGYYTCSNWKNAVSRLNSINQEKRDFEYNYF